MRASEYALAGVNYELIEPFKQEMIEAGRQTLAFPNRRGVYVDEDVLHAHGALFEYRGDPNAAMWRRMLAAFGIRPHISCKTQEGLGNLNWIAEWMYQFDGTGNPRYDVIARAAALIIAIDVIAQGAMPVIWTDEVAAGDSEWFADKKRAQSYGRGCVDVCRELHMALPAGESPSLRYLIKSEPPVKSAPSLSGSITGIIAPKKRKITGKKLRPGSVILGAPSTGLGANGISLVIKRAMTLPEQFLTKLPTGRTLGEESLIPIRSYVALVEALLNAGIDIHAILPATGDGVGKLAFDHRQFTYRINNWGWPEIPPLFQFMRELGVPLMDCLKTFNWGIGIYLFVDPRDVDEAVRVAHEAGYNLHELGVVEDGPRQVIFGPENDLVIPPPGQ